MSLKDDVDELNKHGSKLFPLFLDDGYLNIEGILGLGNPFIFIVGGRGVGKTYGVLKSIYERHQKFMYMRRTKTQAKKVMSEAFNPFKALNNDYGFKVLTGPLDSDLYAFYQGVLSEDGVTLKPAGEPIGIAAGLTVTQNLRGFDGSDIDVLFFDEFIPDATERPIREEAAAFFNTYETINRNRELKGQPAVQAICCANSNKLDNPLFTYLKLIGIGEQMRKNGHFVYFNTKRGLTIIDLPDSPISREKSETALYKLTEGTEFYEMALHNSYNYDDSDVKSMSLSEYRPVVMIGELVLYKHKSAPTWYATTHFSGSPEKYEMTEKDKQRFVELYFQLWPAYINHKITFESYTCESIFRSIFK